MILGFTGTQRGMTKEQQGAFENYVLSCGLHEFHHGDCIGADEQAHKIVRACWHGVRIVGHPPKEDRKRAFCQFDETWMPKPYLERNRDIAGVCDTLIATPGESTEQLRSGTWATVRYARQADKTVVIIQPNGNIVRTSP